MIKLPGFLTLAKKTPLKVSVILPVYNAEKYLHKCIDSIISQDMKDIEVIAVNDCSTDNSLEILKHYSQQCPAFKIIDQPENMGAGAARNKAIKQARGKYLTFIDSDDWFGEHYLENLYTEAEKTGAEIVFSNMMNVKGGAQRKYGAFYQVKNKYQDNNVSLDNLPCDWRSTAPWMKLFNREFIVKNGFKFQQGIRLGAEDIPFSWMAYFAAEKVSFCEGVYYYYNYIPESIDRCVNDNILEIFDVLDFTTKEYLCFDPDKLRYSQLETLYVSHVYYQFTKIMNAEKNIDLASRYWHQAHKKMSALNFANISANTFLLEQEKAYFTDVISHADFNLDMQEKYYS